MKRKAYIFILLLLIMPSVFSQKKKVQNLQMVDYKLLHFGFVLGLHAQDFQVDPSNVPDEDNVTWHGDTPLMSYGFTVGIISDLRLSNYFNLRFVPTLNFGDRELYFSGMKDGQKVDEFHTSVLSTLVDFPFYIKYRSVRINNYRPYLIAGGGVSVDLTRKDDAPVMLKPIDCFTEFGIGCDFYLTYFKLAPELKFHIGFNDMLERNRPAIANEEDVKYTRSISNLTSRLLILTFNFE